MPANPYNLQIRDKIVTMLQGINGAGAYHYDLSAAIKTDFPQQVQQEGTWRINVMYAGEEQVLERMGGGAANKSERTMTVRIRISHRTSATLDVGAILMKAQSDIETAIYTDRTLAGTGGAEDCTYDRTEEVKDELGQVSAGVIDLYFNVKYQK